MSNVADLCKANTQLAAGLSFARAKLEIIRRQVESVRMRGTYIHPDETELQVFRAFERIAAQFSDGDEQPQPQPPPEGTRTHAWIGPGGIVRNGQWVSVVCDVPPPPPPQSERPRNTLPYGSLR